MDDLFAAPAGTRERLAAGAFLLRGFAFKAVSDLVPAIRGIARRAPFRHFTTPGGRPMSVAMTNCGRAGWTSGQAGYAYGVGDPLTGLPWPEMPALLRDLAVAAAAAAGHGGFRPDTCLINRYLPGSRLSLHQDKNERDLAAPIVSVSLGLPATFLFGGARRNHRPRRIRLGHGDVAVWGGPSRLAFHGVVPLTDGEHSLLGRCRINLTFRAAF